MLELRAALAMDRTVRRLAAAGLALTIGAALGACADSRDDLTVSGTDGLDRPEPVSVQDVPELAPATVGVPLPDPSPVGARLAFASCDRFEGDADVIVRYLSAPPAGSTANCAQAPADAERPRGLEALPTTGYVLYVPAEMSVERDTLDAILSAGGALVTVDVMHGDPPPLPPQPEPDLPTGGSTPVDINGQEGRVFRVVDGHAVAAMYPMLGEHRLRIAVDAGAAPREVAAMLAGLSTERR